MKEQVKQQHLQIIDKIKKKYDGRTGYKICQHFVVHRVDDLQEENAKEVMQKFASMFGKKEAYSDDEIVMLILICIVAQRSLPFKEVEPKSFLKYKNKTLKIKQSKSRDESISQPNGNQSKKETVQVPKQQPQQPQTPFEKKERRQSEEAPPLLQKPQPECLPPSSTFPAPPAPVSPLYPDFDRRTSCEDDLQPVPKKDSQVSNTAEPPRKFSFGSSQELDNSISTKMASQIQTDEINECLPETVQTPTFFKKGSSETSRFMESQLELSTRAIAQPKERKILQIRIERYLKQTEFLSTVVRYEIHTPNEGHPPVLRRYSEFLKLQNYLRDAYKGVIIPQLPPKENIVGTFWSSAESTLVERKKGLEEFTNKCLAHQVIGRDPVLMRFIDDQDLEQACYNQDTLRTTAEKYISSLWNITASTQQLKDYGMAYYSYLKNTRQQPEGPPDKLEELYQQVLKQCNKTMKLREYIDKMEAIQLRRNKTEFEFNNNRRPPNLSDTYKKQLQKLLTEFSEAKKTYNDFCNLKTNKNWLEHLYGAKVNKAGQQQLLKDLEEAEQKIDKVFPILQKEMGEFLSQKQRQWPEVLQNFCGWKLSLCN